MQKVEKEVDKMGKEAARRLGKGFERSWAKVGREVAQGGDRRRKH